MNFVPGISPRLLRKLSWPRNSGQEDLPQPSNANYLLLGFRSPICHQIGAKRRIPNSNCYQHSSLPERIETSNIQLHGKEPPWEPMMLLGNTSEKQCLKTNCLAWAFSPVCPNPIPMFVFFFLQKIDQGHCWLFRTRFSSGFSVGAMQGAATSIYRKSQLSCIICHPLSTI